jgi:BirA family biotin operon repressor/biotin-[acetyl-CoA-carboxylase] ligase
MKFKKFIFKKVISTNLTAINLLKKSQLNYGMITADLQTKGKGQYGRKWISIKGNLFVSFFYNLDEIKLSLKKITKLNCNLVKKTISNFYKKKIFFKKPNDLTIDGKKICGILQEVVYRKDKKFLVIGIGINVVKNPLIFDYPTTNLCEITGKNYNKNNVEKLLRFNFENKFRKFFKK